MKECNESTFSYTSNDLDIHECTEDYAVSKRRSESVVESNDLVEASYKLSLNEQRLVLYMASKINREDTEFRLVRVTVKEFADTFGLDYKNIYKEIRKISKSLTSKSIHIKQPDTSDYTYIAWLSSVSYRNGLLELEFSTKLRPYLLELKNNFTKYQLGDFVRFTSTYSIRLYQLLKRYAGFRGTKYYTIEQLRTIFSLENKYPKYSNLKRRVLVTAIEEINAVSDIIVELQEDKELKKVKGIQFKVTSKKQAEEPVQDKVSVDQNLIITVKTLMQTCMTEIVQDKDAIALLKEAKNDVATIMQKIMLVQQSRNKIENVVGFLIESIRNNYSAIEMPVSPQVSKVDYIESHQKYDYEELARLSRER